MTTSRLVGKGVLMTIAWIMIALGVFLAIQPIIGRGPVAGARLLDMLFAAYFLFRGVMNLRKARRIGQPAP